jgi:hypothetical protein
VCSRSSGVQVAFANPLYVARLGLAPYDYEIAEHIAHMSAPRPSPHAPRPSPADPTPLVVFFSGQGDV